MKFIKRNKFTIIAIIALVVLVFIGIQVKNIFVPDEGKAVYGDRLSDISKHKLDSKWFTNIEEKLKENEKVKKIENKVHGKIINLIITISDDVDLNAAKEIANSTVSMFENKELTYYSLQVYVKKEDATLNNFPIIGYKGVESETLSFTKDREIVVEETNDEK